MLIIRVKGSGILPQWGNTTGYFGGNGTVVYFDYGSDYMAVCLTYNHCTIIPQNINFIVCKFKKIILGNRITLNVWFSVNFHEMNFIFHTALEKNSHCYSFWENYNSIYKSMPIFNYFLSIFQIQYIITDCFSV